MGFTPLRVLCTFCLSMEMSRTMSSFFGTPQCCAVTIMSLWVTAAYSLQRTYSEISFAYAMSAYSPSIPKQVDLNWLQMASMHGLKGSLMITSSGLGIDLHTNGRRSTVQSRSGHVSSPRCHL